MSKKGFTLIELLVVVAIIAVLAVTVTLILNPAELVKQGRDATRLSDLSALQSAVALYLADVASPGIGGADGTACSSLSEWCTSGTTGRAAATCSVTTSTVVDGSGWVKVDFAQISSGSPLARLPMDPNNTSTNCGEGNEACFYSYACNGTYYELNAAMESTRYINGGGSDVESDDGGDDENLYEVGNDPGLDL